MLEGENVSAILTKSLEKSFNNGIVTPIKMKRCNKGIGEIVCITCNNQVNENQEFEANLNELKKGPPNQFDHVLPYHKV